MEDKFVLTRKSKYRQTGNYPRVHVSAETYAILTDWAIQTEQPLSKLIGQAVKFAAEHTVFVDE